MSIMPGMQLGAYQVVAQLGAGGMGVVYRAKDTRLDREVAIKVLPTEFAQDADRLKRFEQEARATSALNHPNILTVYDIGTHEGAPFIVAELLEGEELRAQLDQGALPVRRCVEYAQQIAAGLAAAHERGVVHRDLKPENLFVTKDGRVKILDFGLAKLRPQKFGGGVDSEAPTLKPLTNPGVVLGTVGYMSPEQVRGQEADHRADIFAFGMILYEMLSGKRAFSGVSEADVMSAILKEEPPELSETNAKVSPQLEKLVRHCLEKKPELRFQSARDLGFALEALSTTSGARLETTDGLSAQTIANKARWFGNVRLWEVATAIAVLAFLATLPFAVKYLRQTPSAETGEVRYTIAAPEKVIRLQSPVISPDGRNLVFKANVEGGVRLWLRPLGSLTAQLLSETEVGDLPPFWSPDSRSVCFSTRDGKLTKFDLAGGAPQTLCDLARISRIVYGGAWSRDGVILFATGKGIYRIPATGGEPALVLGSAQPNREATVFCPAFLPDGHHFLYFNASKRLGASGIYLASLDSKETTQLLTADSQAVYTTSATGNGYLVFVRAGALMAQPFEASKLKLAGEPFVVADKVAVFANLFGLFSASDNGTLVYNAADFFDNQQLTWVDRTGKQLEPAIAVGMIENIQLSPDGRRVALVQRDPHTSTNDIFVMDLARSNASTRITFDPGEDRFPTWSPDGSHIAWTAHRNGAYQIYQKLASGAGPEELLFTSELPIIFCSWSPDGRFILYDQRDPKTLSDMWVLPLQGDRKPSLFLQTPFNEHFGYFSPDGRWIVYQSDDSGKDEVYVRTFPDTGGKWQVSKNGGSSNAWRSDGKELFYFADKLMAVEVKLGSSFEAIEPQALFDQRSQRRIWGTYYGVSADGQRFLFVTQKQGASNLQYTVVVNWAAEVKK